MQRALFDVPSTSTLHAAMLASAVRQKYRGLRTGLSGLGASIPIQLTVDQSIMTVGKTARFRIIGAPANQQIYWSSYKNGQATGELNAGYGDRTAANGTADLPFTPRAEDVGSWVKEVLVQDAGGNNYTALVQFGVQSAAAAATAGVAAPPPSSGGGFLDKLTNDGFNIGGIFIPYVAALAVGGVGFLLISKRR